VTAASSAHVSDADIEGFHRGGLPPPVLIAFTRHVADCEACRLRVADAGMAARAEQAFESAVGLDGGHVPEDDIHAYVDGALDAARRGEIEAHTARCASCAEEVRDLRQFARGGASRRGSAWWYAGLAAAAALLLAVALPWLLRSQPPSPLLVLNDGGTTIAVDRSGQVGSFARLSDADAAQVRDALLGQQIVVPPDVAALARQRGQLRGEASADAFRAVAPLATAVLTDRPVFRWTPMAPGASYVVTLREQASGVTVSGAPVSGTEWVPEAPLTRGATYVWQVQGTVSGQEAIAPAPPAPPATFIVMPAVEAERLGRAPASHLVRGILYANAGALDEAEAELSRLRAQNPGAEPVERLVAALAKLRAEPASRQP
jgi:anti-sigma factor RsiW